MWNKEKATIAKAFTDKAAVKIAQCITQLQKGFGSGMNRLTRNFSPLTWKLLIVVFASLWGMASVRCISGAFDKPIAKSLNNTMHIVTRKVHADSLALLEHIYEQRKKN